MHQGYTLIGLADGECCEEKPFLVLQLSSKFHNRTTGRQEQTNAVTTSALLYNTLFQMHGSRIDLQQLRGNTLPGYVYLS